MSAPAEQSSPTSSRWEWNAAICKAVAPSLSVACASSGSTSSIALARASSPASSAAKKSISRFINDDSSTQRDSLRRGYDDGHARSNMKKVFIRRCWERSVAWFGILLLGSASSLYGEIDWKKIDAETFDHFTRLV